MNEEIKDKWIAALRSGEYVQGFGQLKCEDGSYCCLGVLCEVVKKEDPSMTIDDHLSVPPLNVAEAVGFSYARNPMTNEPLPRDPTIKATLAELNDSRLYDFDKIADIIERDL